MTIAYNSPQDSRCPFCGEWLPGLDDICKACLDELDRQEKEQLALLGSGTYKHGPKNPLLYSEEDLKDLDCPFPPEEGYE